MKLMSLDVVDLREFYASPLGAVVRRLLRERLSRVWPDARGLKVMAVGYGAPFLRPWLDEASAVLAAMPANQGATYWPREGKNVSFLVDTHNLPLPDESVDRIVFIHSLENSGDPESMLREAWRVLKSDGRLLAIVPNRRGVWAHGDRTPFGIGRPYSSFQIKDMLRDQGFLTIKVRRALHFPPWHFGWMLALAAGLEKYVGFIYSGFGGILLAEAEKRVYAPLLIGSKSIKGRRLTVPLPISARNTYRPSLK